MNITIKNLSDEASAVVTVNSTEYEVDKSSSIEVEIPSNEMNATVSFNRDFSTIFEDQDGTSKWLNKTVGKAMVQVQNEYFVFDLKNGDVLTIDERCHYIPPTKKEAFYKCLPALYYVGQLEANGARVSISKSFAKNQKEYVKFYRKFLMLANSNGWFKILRYFKQFKRYKSLSSEAEITKRMSDLYSLPAEEREYQFQPVRVIVDKKINDILEKLPKKLRAKASGKIDEFKDKYLNE